MSIEKMHSHPGEKKHSIRRRLQPILLGSLLFIGCPGDDITAILSNWVPFLTRVIQNTGINPIEILGVWWIDRELKEHQPNFLLYTKKIQTVQVHQNIYRAKPLKLNAGYSPTNFQTHSRRPQKY